MLMHIEDIAAELGISRRSLDCYLSQNRLEGAPRPLRRGYYDFEEVLAFRDARKRDGIEKRRRWMLAHKPNSRERRAGRLTGEESPSVRQRRLAPPERHRPSYVRGGSVANPALEEFPGETVAEPPGMFERPQEAELSSPVEPQADTQPQHEATTEGAVAGELPNDAKSLLEQWLLKEASAQLQADVLPPVADEDGIGRSTEESEVVDEAATSSTNSSDPMKEKVSPATVETAEASAEDGGCGEDVPSPSIAAPAAAPALRGLIEANTGGASLPIPAPPVLSNPWLRAGRIAVGAAGLGALGFGLYKAWQKVAETNRAVETARRKVASATGQKPVPLSLKDKLKIMGNLATGKDVKAQVAQELARERRQRARRKKAVANRPPRQQPSGQIGNPETLADAPLLGNIIRTSHQRKPTPQVINPPTHPAPRSPGFEFPGLLGDIIVPDNDGDSSPPAIIR